MNGFFLTAIWLGPLLLYWMLYGWYDPIGRGDRFMMSLYIPFLAFPLWFSQRLTQIASTHRRAVSIVFGAGILILCMILAARFVQILKHPFFG